MQRIEGAPQSAKPPHAMGVWWLCAALLLGPSLLVWLVRLTVLSMNCAPGPGVCRHIAIGAGFRDALNLCWMIGSHAPVSLAVAFVAAIAGLSLRRPLMASLSVMILPIAALVLPTLAVYTALYPGCEANEAGVGDCLLWGAQMGMSFHRAAMAPWIIYGFAPYSFTFALMIGAIGLLFFRPGAAIPPASTIRSRFDRAARSFHDSPE